MEEDLKILNDYLDENDKKFVKPKRLKFLQAIENLINKYKEQEKIIELYEEKLMFALSPTTHELAQDTKQNFKKIIRENINEDTYTIKKVLKAYWNKKAKGE